MYSTIPFRALNKYRTVNWEVVIPTHAFHFTYDSGTLSFLGGKFNHKVVRAVSVTYFQVGCGSRPLIHEAFE